MGHAGLKGKNSLEPKVLITIGWKFEQKTGNKSKGKDSTYLEHITIYTEHVTRQHRSNLFNMKKKLFPDVAAKTLGTQKVEMRGDSTCNVYDILTIFLKIIHYSFCLVHFWNFILVAVANYFIIICFEKNIFSSTTWHILYFLIKKTWHVTFFGSDFWPALTYHKNSLRYKSIS